MNDYCLVIFDQISSYCFHCTSPKSLRENSKFKQARNSLETPPQEKPGVCFCVFLFWNHVSQEVTKMRIHWNNLCQKCRYHMRVCAQRLVLCVIAKTAFQWHRWAIIHLLNPPEMVPQQPRYFLEAPIRVPWITLTLCELEVSQDREELWKRPFLHQEAAEMATQLLGLCGLCSCASEAGSS